MKIALRPERDQFLVRERSTAPTGHTVGICHHRPPRVVLARRVALRLPQCPEPHCIHKSATCRADRAHDQNMLSHAVIVELVCAHRGQTLVGWDSGRTERKVPLHRSKQDLTTPR